jgi:hypothetical protein
MIPTMIDERAPIVPGQTAAGILIGGDVQLLLAQQPAVSIEERKRDTVYNFGSVRVWSSGRVIKQIAVSGGYSGSLFDHIRIGSTIADVEECLGCDVEEDEEENLVAPGSLGWSFETEEWDGHSLRENRNTRITEIFVFA